MNDDIEILDIFDGKRETKKIADESEPIKKQVNKVEVPKKVIVEETKTTSKSKKKKRKVKVRAFQILFCSVSFIFLLGCLIYYGSRFIKYYRIYNPKIDSSADVLLGNYIPNVASEIVYEGDGLYISAGNYLYKGDVKDNYVKFNGMLWRIIKINTDKSVEMILDDYINILPWNKESTELKKSDIYKYLNTDFINSLDKSKLAPMNICEDKITDLSKITCDSQSSDTFVRLLDVTGFLNTVRDKKTFLSSDEEIYWLNDYNEGKVWHTNGSNVSMSDANTFYEIRPVVKLKSEIIYKEGKGTKDEPYIIDDENKLGLGSIVLLDKDEWIVYETGDVIKLMRKDVISEEHSFDRDYLIYDAERKDSLAEYLNTKYLDSLSYKNMIVNSDWYTGSYKDSLEDIKKEKTNAKVGIPNLLDIKIDSKVNSYFTMTSNGEIIYVYENPLRPSRETSKRKIRPCIAISKSDADKLKYDNGVFKVGE